MDFKIYDLTLQSTIPFRELAGATARRPRLTFRLDLRARVPVEPRVWSRHWTLPCGRPWLLVGRTGEEVVLRFPRLADFTIATGAWEVTCYGRPKTPRATLRHLWLDQALPLLLSMHGRIVLHASAVSTPRGAVAFVASPRTGKSTMAASLSGLGWTLVADDGLLVTRRAGRVVAVPSYPGLRLWPDALVTLPGSTRSSGAVAHYTDKQRLTPAAAGVRYDGRAQTLARIYELKRRGARSRVSISRLSGREALVALIKHTYCLETQNRERLASQFERLSRDSRAVVVRRLSVPRDLTKLDRARDAILEDLRAG